MANDNEPTFLEWLGFNPAPKLSKHRKLGGFLGFVLFLLALVLIALFLILIIELFRSLFSTDDASDVRNVGLVLAAVVGAPFIIWRAVVAQAQSDTAREGLITERINKAVENLGAEKQSYDAEGRPSFVPNLEVRIGGIYALERIAQDSARDHIQIMEILCAYIRENAKAEDAVNFPFHPWKPWNGEGDLAEHLSRCAERFGQAHEDTQARKWAKTLPSGRSDVQSALDVIGRRSPERIRSIEQRVDRFGQFPAFRLDLRNTNLQGCGLSGYNFSYAHFHNARLDGAELYRTELVGCHFYGASLIGCAAHHSNLNKAHVTSADFEGANLNHARMLDTAPRNLSGASLNEVSIWGGWADSISFEGSTLTGADFSGRRFSNCSFVGSDMTNVKLNYCRVETSYFDGARRLESVTTDGATFEDMTTPPELKRCD